MKGAAHFVFSLLLCMLAASPFIFSLCFNIYRMAVRYEAREALEIKESISITVPVGELYWIEKDKELMIQGELFDVKEYTIHGDSVILTGLYDKDETLIVNKLNSLQDESNTTLALFKWFSYFADDIKDYRFTFQPVTGVYYRQCFFSDKLSPCLYSNEAPPPWIFLS